MTYFGLFLTESYPVASEDLEYSVFKYKSMVLWCFSDFFKIFCLFHGNKITAYKFTRT